MTTEDDDTLIRGRDLRVMWRTVTVVAIIVATCIGAIIAAVSWAVRHDARLESVEKWQSNKDREAARELWRRGRPETKP
jgi:hypothetical protein